MTNGPNGIRDRANQLVRDTLSQAGITPCYDNSCQLARPAGMATNGGCLCAENLEDRTGVRHFVMRMGRVISALATEVVSLKARLSLAHDPPTVRSRSVAFFRPQRRSFVLVGVAVCDTLDDAKSLAWAVRSVSQCRAFVLPDEEAEMRAEVPESERSRIP